MLVNIPIQIDEHIFEMKVQDEYDQVITNELIKMIKNTLIDECDWYQTRDAKNGMKTLISKKVETYLQEWKPEIIEAAAEELAKRTLRSKSWKEKWGEIDAD